MFQAMHAWVDQEIPLFQRYYGLQQSCSRYIPYPVAGRLSSTLHLKTRKVPARLASSFLKRALLWNLESDARNYLLKSFSQQHKFTKSGLGMKEFRQRNIQMCWFKGVKGLI